jgi:hypothetical protein
VASREPEFELVIFERAFGGYIHQLVSQFAKAEILEIDLSEEILTEPGQEIESDGRQLKEIVDGIVAARSQMFNRKTIFGAFDQGLDGLTLVVAVEYGRGVGSLGREIGIQMGIRQSVAALGHEFHQDDAHRMLTLSDALKS